jgi:DNA topoisomerase-1
MAGQKLVIVESPTKARTIRKFLGDGFRVEASMGHVRDLPSSADEIPDVIRSEKWSRLGVDIENGFEPVYIIPATKKKVVAELRKALKEADELYLATDEDREGESIAWHLVQVLKPKVPTRRMVFHEITKDAITKALADSREIDSKLVEAQEVRRVLDRLVGYEVSPLLWKKVAPRLSAGRVQSVAVRMLVLRERERMVFHAGSYWDVAAKLSASGTDFVAKLSTLDGTAIAQGRDFDEKTGKIKDGKKVLLVDEAAARALSTGLEGVPFEVASVDRKLATRKPYAPFTTSTLQQEANRKLSLSARDTMSVAQRLYERGLITYMRTDSVHLSNEAISASRGLVERRFGSNYLSPEPRQFTTSSKGAQEAHEAIRPAGTEMLTATEHALSGIEGRLYELIWKRTVATQMADAQLAFTTAQIRAVASEGQVANFRASGREVLFPGFFAAYVESTDDPAAAMDDKSEPLPSLNENQKVDCMSTEPLGHETRPPARYTEATLVKALEKEGIGRPSTYASIIDTIKARGYVGDKSKQLTPTFTAMAVTKLLEQTHRQIVDTEFTAGMEKVLDSIAEGDAPDGFLASFYDENVLRGIAGAVEIHPRDICTIEIPQSSFSVRVGKYGPYVEHLVEGAEKPVIVSLAADLAPADVTSALVADLLRKKEKGDEPLGTHPDEGVPVFVLNGRFGPYVQLGEVTEEIPKPKRVSLLPGMDMDDVTLELALSLLSLPRFVGNHPEEGDEIVADVGRYGPYVRHKRTFASLDKKLDNVLTVDLARALDLIANKAKRGVREVLRELGAHPEDDAPMQILDGRYGPYIKHNKTNASLPKGVAPEEVTVEQAVELLEARAKAPKKKKKRRAPAKKKK